MFETVIVPLDGSELAETALAPAQELRDKFGANLILLRTIEPVSHHIATQPPGLFESPAAAEANIELLGEVVDAEREEATKYLEALGGRVGRAEFLVVEGQPGEAIISTADERPGSLIVMASHGRSGLGRVIFGSVADHVLRNTHTPVMLIRLEETEQS